MQERDPGAIEDFLHSDASSDSFPLIDRGIRKDLLDLVVSSADLIRTLLRTGDRLIFERDSLHAQVTAAFCEQLLLLRDRHVDLARWGEGLFRLSGRRVVSDTDLNFANAITEIESSDRFARFVLNLLLTKRELDLDDVQNGAAEFAADSQNWIIKREVKYIVIWCILQGDFVSLLNNVFCIGFGYWDTILLVSAAIFLVLNEPMLGPRLRGEYVRWLRLRLCLAGVAR
jgi:hypothetical protein